jgi:LuxR family maltose regulon positive regulatory protein
VPAQILSTKLSIPSLRSRLVSRPRLIEKLNQGLECGLILVSGPAGYGKSTLLSDWLSQVGLATAWLSLDDGDNDPARFWAYVIAALQGAFHSFGRTLPDTLTVSNQPSDAVITQLINALDELSQPLILILDDYHYIVSQTIHEGILFLLEHAPAHFHLVIATRADPPLPLARLRARSDMLEMRQSDLRFTTLEAADFLNHSMGLQISSEDVARITARTEGWIAGLQMVALSMQNTADVSSFITALTGSHRYIFDYLLEEILERQSPEIRRFLLYTSILDQLTAPLCDALFRENTDGSPMRSSAVILEELERTNLFIIPLDHERRWYRYHSLFAELLRGYLQQTYADQIRILHTLASAWFEGQGLVADAIHHALMGGDWEGVVGLISANVFALLEQNELNTVARQLDNLASEKGFARPWLWIGRAWLAAYTGQLSTVDSRLDMTEAEISSLEDQEHQQTLRGHCAAIRAFAAWVAGKKDVAIQAAQEALDCLPETDRTIRCQSATVLGLSMKNMDARAQAFAQALDYARGSSVSHVVLFAHGCQAYLLVMQGRLREAHAACREAMELANSSNTRQPLPTLSHVYSTLSGILWEWNDLEAALHYAREAVALARRWGQADALHFAYTNLGEALFANGDVEDALNTLQQAWQIAHRTSAWFEEITVCQEIEWYLAQDNLEAALQRLRLAQLNIDETPKVYFSPLLALSFAQIFLARKEYAKALTEIDSILSALEKQKNIYFQVRVLAWQAKAYRALGQETPAFASLKKALMLAAPEGYMRSFLAAGNALISLLHQARAVRIAPNYVDKLLVFLNGEDKAAPPATGASSRLIEALSEREMDVLKLLAQGCSDKRIAEALVIARETVHKHLKNIYGKLEVHSRGEAVIRARELGLL